MRTGAGLAVTATFVVTGAGPAVADLVGGAGWVVQLVAVLVALEVSHLVVDVPLDAWVDLVHDRRWGLSTTTAGRLAADEAKSLVLGTVVGVGRAGRGLRPRAVDDAGGGCGPGWSWWWSGRWRALVVPVVVAPLFNRFEPLAAG